MVYNLYSIMDQWPMTLYIIEIGDMVKEIIAPSEQTEVPRITFEIHMRLKCRI